MEPFEEGLEMRTSNVTRIALACFIAASAMAWLGCAADTAGPEGVGATSQGVVASSSGTNTAPPPPYCYNGPYVDGVPNTVWALPFSESDPGYFTKYTIKFPAIPAVISNAQVRNYEQQIWDLVSGSPLGLGGSNGFEFKISQTKPVQGVAPTLYYAVCINDEGTQRASHPRVFDNVASPPLTSDWDNECSIAAQGSTESVVAAISPPPTCVQVVAYDPGYADDGTVIGFCTVLDEHDPKGPAWIQP
jgi:hypothetical protein